jgi:TetR/AcrR family transcriptional regulator
MAKAATVIPDRSVRKRLLEGAADLFTRKGYAATTVREIVAAAGVTKPVLYYYFHNKEGIYLELMRTGFAKLENLLEAAAGEKGGAAQRLLRLSDRIFALFLENIKVVRVMYAIYYGPHQGAPFFDFDVYHLKFQEAIRRLVNEGIRRGEFHRGNAREMAWAILGAITVAIDMRLGTAEVALGNEELARVLKLILRGFTLEKGRRKGAVP